jgi:glycerol-1-phosphate dehydrogenase [NAD(P)+]
MAPLGVFLDLTVLAAAPVRMIRAGLGDVLCRSTAQVDWLLAHVLLGTTYAEDPFAIQADDERILLDRAGDLARGDLNAIRALARLLALSGLGMLLVGSSHPGSGGEHAISHYLDMFLRPHPGSLHGEQVGVASRTMARLQAEILAREQPPTVAPQRIDADAMRQRYGRLAGECLAVMRKKALDADAAETFNARLAERWPAIRARLQAVALPPERIEQAMRSAGAATVPEDLGTDSAFYRAAVLHAREIRERYSMLDLAADAGLLKSFVDRLPQAAGSSNSAVDR